MSETYTILFLGDVVGEPGRTVVQKALPSILETHGPLFTIINGENSAGGVGITPKIADGFFAWGADAITLGNHAFNKREIIPYLDSGKAIVRPLNMPKAVPGKGALCLEKQGIKLWVINACGRVFLDAYDDPFAALENLEPQLDSAHRFLDFHAEATSEKIAMGYNLAAKYSAVVGTHTHVTTADEQILEGGTAYITDVGMCGPVRSVLGMNKDVILNRFRTSLSDKFVVADEPGVLSGVVIDVERKTGRAKSIQRIRYSEAL